MRSLLVISAIVASAAAHATFTTTNFVMSVVTATSVETLTPISMKRVISGFTIGGNTNSNIVWTYNFNTGTSPAFNAVKFTIKGFSTPGADGRVRGSENIFSTDPSVVLVGADVAYADPVNNTNGNLNFIATVDIPFTQAASIGFGSKDISIRNLSSSGQITITEITQEFTPVPEPATMTALGLGVVAMLKRRRK